MNVAGAAIRHSRAVVLVVAALVVAGAFAAFSLPSSIYPPLQFPRIVAIVKGLTPWDALDTGMFVFTPALYAALRAATTTT